MGACSESYPKCDRSWRGCYNLSQRRRRFMFFPRRDFLKVLAGWLGATQVSQLGAGPPTTEQIEKGDPNTKATVEIGGNSGGDQIDADVIRAQFDLIVVGGGYSGTACAISAARNGVKVALVHERSMLGGK